MLKICGKKKRNQQTRSIDYYSNRHALVVSHSLRGYDGPLIIKMLIMRFKLLIKTYIFAIPISSENFMSINIGHLRFIDLMQFIPRS